MNSFVELKYFKKEKNMFGVKMQVESKNGKVLLRPMSKDDLPNLVEHFSSMKIHMYTLGTFGQTLENELDWYNSVRTEKTSCIWAIQPENSSVAIGVTSLRSISAIDNSCESGIVIWDKNYWGQGVASAAHIARTMFAADFLNRKIIRSHVRSENEASFRALLGVGYTSWGVEPLSGFRGGKWLNSYSLIWMHPDHINSFYPSGLPEKFKDGVEKARSALEKARSVVEFL